MKIFRQLILTTITTASLLSVHAQTADDIIAKHVEALGGKDKVASVKSMHLETTMEVMGTSSTATATLVVGQGFKSVAEFNGQSIIQVVTDKGGWAFNPLAGASEPEAMTDEQFKASKEQIYFSPLFSYAASGAKVELKGKEKAGAGEVYKITYSTSDDSKTDFYIDAATYMITKAVKTGNIMGQETEITSTFSDNRKTDFGVVIPYSSEVDFGGQFSISSKVTKAEINPTVDPAIFVMKK